MGLGDGFATAHDLPLRHCVDSIDVIKTLALRAVALVHGVDPHEAGLAARIGLAALADVHRRGTSLGVMDAVFSIRPAAPQVVDVGGRDRGQSFVLGQAVDLVFALQYAAHGRGGEAFVGAIGLGQPDDIFGRVTAQETMAPRGSRLDHAAFAPAGDQAGDLGHAESSDLDEIAAHDSLVFFRQTQVFLGAQDAFDQAVNLLAAGAGEAESVAGNEKLSHLGQRETFGMLHGDLHSPAVCPDPA